MTESIERARKLRVDPFASKNDAMVVQAELLADILELLNAGAPAPAKHEIASSAPVTKDRLTTVARIIHPYTTVGVRVHDYGDNICEQPTSGYTFSCMILTAVVAQEILDAL